MATYTNSSPWYTTQVKQDYLDVLAIRPVSAETDDMIFTITPQYANRPDLLAHDLYGDVNLWWVFMQRNLDVIQDPIFDFTPGTKIYLPKGSSLKQILGL